jgi:hypothetical protein
LVSKPTGDGLSMYLFRKSQDLPIRRDGELLFARLAM